MSDLQDTLDAIDELAVHECGQCGRRLREDGPSRDFCGELCQAAWQAGKRQVAALVHNERPSVESHLRPDRPRIAGSGDLRADLRAAQDMISRLNYGHPNELRRDTWFARFASPWHPDPEMVRAEPRSGRPPYMLNQIRLVGAPRMWTAADEADPFEVAYIQDVYYLESVDERHGSALYRVRDLPGPRLAVFRIGSWMPPAWWHQQGWDGRHIDVEGEARGYQWVSHTGDRVIGVPTERYETLEDGTVAEVWEPRPDSEWRRSR